MFTNLLKFKFDDSCQNLCFKADISRTASLNDLLIRKSLSNDVHKVKRVRKKSYFKIDSCQISFSNPDNSKALHLTLLFIRKTFTYINPMLA